MKSEKEKQQNWQEIDVNWRKMVFVSLWHFASL